MRRFRDLTTKEKKEYLAILLLLPFAYIGHLFRKANFRTLPKRAVAVCLALVMIAVMFPIMSIPASAEEYSGGTVQTFNLKKGDLIHAGVTVKGRPDLPFRVYRTPGPNEPISAYLIVDNVESWTADKNYYVVWDGSSTHLLLYPASDITFYPGGGTAGGTTAPSTFLAVEETDRYYDVSWLNPYRPGCTFLGWYTSDGTEQVYDANGKAVNGTYWQNNIWQGQGAKSFIAKWKANTSVTFRYFPGGGTGQPDNFEQWTANATYFDTYPSDSHWNYTSGKYKLTRVGYTATGNYAKKDGSCVVHEDQTFTSYPQLCEAYGLNPDTCGNATVDIYAQWAPINYTVTFNGNGGSVGTPSKTVTYDSTYGDLPEPTKKGYIFDGWYTNQNFETKVTRITEVQITENQTLYAKWRPNTYQANLYANGGSVSPTSIIVTYDSPYGTLPTPTRTGYTFNGWFTQSSGGDRVESTTVVKTASTHSLCAQWDANTYTVNFNANGGSVGTPSKTVTYDSTYGELPTPTRENHTFTGWFTAAEGGTQITSTTAVKITESQTLYARWNINTYTVTWKNHDGSVLETDTGVVHGTTPTYNGAIPQKPDDENFTYTFGGWSPALSAVTDDTEYVAQFTAVSKRVDPTYTVTIPATVTEGESFAISASGVVLNTNEKLTVTLQSDFKLKSAQNAELSFEINDGAITNNAVVLSVAGNGDKNNPLSLNSAPLTIEVAEQPKYAGIYTGTITFTIAVDTAENN